jgi:hypothetical protein
MERRDPMELLFLAALLAAVLGIGILGTAAWRFVWA